MTKIKELQKRVKKLENIIRWMTDGQSVSWTEDTYDEQMAEDEEEWRLKNASLLPAGKSRKLPSGVRGCKHD